MMEGGCIKEADGLEGAQLSPISLIITYCSVLFQKTAAPTHVIVQEQRAIIHLFKSISSFVYAFTQEIRVEVHDINGG